MPYRNDFSLDVAKKTDAIGEFDTKILGDGLADVGETGFSRDHRSGVSISPAASNTPAFAKKSACILKKPLYTAVNQAVLSQGVIADHAAG